MQLKSLRNMWEDNNKIKLKDTVGVYGWNSSDSEGCCEK
jgi:hypothetical protein